MHLICYLSVYFLKIINFSYLFYLWLKWRINKVAFTLPLVSAFSVYELSFAVQFWCLLVSCPKKYERHMTGLLDVSNKTVNDIIIFIIGSLSLLSLFPWFSFSCYSFLREDTWNTLGSMPGLPETPVYRPISEPRKLFSFFVLLLYKNLPFSWHVQGNFLLQNKLVVISGLW